MARSFYDPDNAARVGDIIRQLREAAGISQTELYRAVGISESSLYRIEHGQVEPSAETIAGIAEALSISLVDLADILGLDESTIAKGLPEPAVYFRTKYGLPKVATDELEKQFEKLAKKHGIDPNQPGPLPGEDEH